jgi:MerR family transcriptional regulator, light-induced transcriptional regulator
MYSIKQASIRSGVSIPLIRAWERRYGVVAPHRTASGYRMYDDDAIATLVRVRELVDTGWAPSEASRAVLAGEVGPSAAVLPVPAGSETAHREMLITRYVEAAILLDIATIGAVLDEMFAQGSYEAIVDDLLMPAAVALGTAWSEGRLDVAGEHAASAALERRLAALFEAAAVPRSPLMMVGLPPGSRHALGALAFAVAVRRQGVEVLWLGADVPVSSWVRVMRQGTVRLAVVGVVTRDDRKGAERVAQALRDEAHAPVVAVGGRHARWEGIAQAGIITLPDRINEAADMAARLARGTFAPDG